MDDEIKPQKPNSTRAGYCRPPEHPRFRKGRSGNSRGRPPGTLNISTLLTRILRRRVVVTENGKRKTCTQLEVSLQQVANKAASGDLKALQLLARLVGSAEERAISTASPTTEIDEADEMVILEILKRLEPTNEGDKEDADETGSK
jgi:hypothetical protein